jgi:hypothetical protein
MNMFDGDQSTSRCRVATRLAGQLIQQPVIDWLVNDGAFRLGAGED